MSYQSMYLLGNAGEDAPNPDPAYTETNNAVSKAIHTHRVGKGTANCVNPSKLL